MKITDNELYELLLLQWGTTRMADYCYTSSKYIKSGDVYINVGNSKPTIDRTMWYDDETESPEANFENFKQYNMRSAPDTYKERYGESFGNWRKAYIIPNYHGDKTNGRLACVTIKGDDDIFSGNERLATETELKMIDAAILEIRADYEKRLATYWKRYSSKVHASGYWANR